MHLLSSPAAPAPSSSWSPRPRSTSPAVASRACGSTAEGRRSLATERLVLAAGPLLPDAARLLGLTLPVFSEQHHKIAIEDTRGAVPRDAPFLIWTMPRPSPGAPRSARRSRPSPSSAGCSSRSRRASHAPGGREPGEPDAARALVVRLGADRRRRSRCRSRPTTPTGFAGWRACCRASPGTRPAMPRAYVYGGYYAKTRENRPTE